ncbi:MAG: PH domain-containing protein, partial [Promethearchaeota archaeon]
MEQSYTQEKNLHLIESSYVTREMIGSVLGSFFIGLIIYGIGWMIVLISTNDGNPVNQAILWPIIFGIILGLVILFNGLNYAFSILYLKNFSYEFSTKFITIRYGVFTKTKTTIPYSRIQNIAVFQNVRDRLLNIYTVKIETAGSSAA